jgi:hypothetical protein
VEECVLIDHRYYRIKPGMVPAHLDIYEKHGFAAQSRHLGKPFAYLFTESGEVNTLVHMWLYDDVADRAKKRAAMAADPEWQNYLRLNNEAGYTVSQQNNSGDRPLVVSGGFIRHRPSGARASANPGIQAVEVARPSGLRVRRFAPPRNDTVNGLRGNRTPAAKAAAASGQIRVVPL